MRMVNAHKFRFVHAMRAHQPVNAVDFLFSTFFFCISQFFFLSFSVFCTKKNEKKKINVNMTQRLKPQHIIIADQKLTQNNKY